MGSAVPKLGLAVGAGEGQAGGQAPVQTASEGRVWSEGRV